MYDLGTESLFRGILPLNLKVSLALRTDTQRKQKKYIPFVNVWVAKIYHSSSGNDSFCDKNENSDENLLTHLLKRRNRICSDCSGILSSPSFFFVYARCEWTIDA